jgi:hypothetical protein
VPAAKAGVTAERIELGHGLSLRIVATAADAPAAGTRSVATGGGATSAAATPFPTRRLQKGLLLYAGEQEMAGEGVGLGVPILKRGAQTIFPSAVRLRSGASDGADPVRETSADPVREIAATYRLDLVERLVKARGGSVRPRALYAAKDLLAALHRRVPALRRPLTAVSSAGRRVLGWSTTYEPSEFRADVPVSYTFREGGRTIVVTADLTDLAEAGVNEIVFMNELGAHEFDLYEDADGASLGGAAIGTWDVVTAPRARFVSTRRGVAFSLAQTPGATLRRGRELVGSRLAWAGFGLSVRPAHGLFSYHVRIEGPA